MMHISHALHRGVRITPAAPKAGYFTSPRAADILTTAYLGSLHPAAVETTLVRLMATPEETLCRRMLNDLHRIWPHIGQTVRTWPAFAEDLERERLIPRLLGHQPAYRQEIHRSLWAVLVDLAAAGEAKGDIADRLGRFGL